MTTATPDVALRYATPALAWTDALPIGNGNLGAMAFGGTAQDRLQINDDTCWTGAPRVRPTRGAGLVPGQAPEVLAAARAAVAAGDVPRAEALVQRLQSGRSEAYQPLVDLWITDAGAPETTADYRRWLRLDEAVAGHSWSDGGAAVHQEVFASRPAGALVAHRRMQAPTDLVVRVGSDHRLLEVRAAGSPRGATWSALVRMPAVSTDPNAPGPAAGAPPATPPPPGAAVTCAVALRLQTDGVVTARTTGLEVRGATWLTVLLASQSDYAGAHRVLHGDGTRLLAEASERLERADASTFADLRAAHVADHRALFDRVGLRLGRGPGASRDTDERLREHRATGTDSSLAALAFAYGRYLTIAGSRPGTLPLNLQGIWNESLRPPWRSNYTININTEMNYWPALSTNLAECDEPLTRWLEDLAAAGSGTAREIYRAGGWVAHHNSDAWAFTDPVGDGTHPARWSFWPFGGVWLTRHLIDHYDFTGDLDALARARPVILGAAQFVLDTLVAMPDGTLGTSPATSPENSFVTADGTPGAVTASTTSDLAMARDLLAGVRRLAGVDVGDGGPFADEPLLARVDAALARLPGERVMADGRIAEWHLADLPEAEPEHRHQSHLFGVHPGTSIDPDQAPDLAAAALATLAARGLASTGWSLAWRLNLRARLRDPDGAQAAIDAFLRPVEQAGPAVVSVQGGGVYRSLLCAHPPFQIDGNLGFTAGVAELLVQGHRFTSDGVREIHLLPCLPPAWADGAVHGLRVRGAITVDLEWAHGGLRTATLTPDRDTTVSVRAGDDHAVHHLTAGRPATIRP
ncbi:glycosyl hydrolase family 95 catalytic domain-containing protein [Occultella gossypii]|uniref:Glycoside hydrolase family 95 protein n=1 Tax=Occultella gossypii TaxID=2800820 RepID=A0ABS7SAS6_9MICO|nr:glycoside hydrolase N-terminal domain-containing protein [Occultella gossypii]MBZ2197445.1 glycoside hydrolase family 95 protein [Occultella gossypii]